MMRESPLNNDMSVAYSYIAAVDLTTGTVDVLKSLDGKGLGQYSGAMDQNQQKAQVLKEVADSYQDMYLDFINMNTVAERLKGKDSLNCIFQRRDGNWTLSAIVPQGVDNQGNVISVMVANRDITVLRNWEQEQKRALELALEDAKEALGRVKKSTEIISAISSIYWAIYVIHLEEDTYEEVNGGAVLPQWIGKKGIASNMFEIGLEKIVAKEDQDIMREFLDLSTLPERLKNETTIVREYRTMSGHWHMGRFIVKSRNASGQVDKVLYAVNVIDERKQNELNYQRTLQNNYEQIQEKNMILTALADDYEDVYLCDLFDDSIQIVKEIDSPLVQDKVGAKFCYSSRQADFSKNYMEPEDGENLLKKMSRESLLEYFKDHRRIAVQYRVKPNQMGYTNMESRFVKVDSQDGLKVVMGSRKIDDIVNRQEEQKEKLQEQLSIFHSLSRNFTNIYIVNLYQRTAKVLKFQDKYNDGTIDEVLDQVFDYEKFLNKWIRGSVHPDDQEILMKSLSPENLCDILSKQDEYSGIYRMLADGKELHYQFDISKMDQEGYVIAGFQSIDTIIRERIEEEKRQREKDEQYHMELLHAKREAEKANATKTDFLRRMSHDIRTPINGIRGMVQIANHNMNSPKKLMECSNKIWKSTDHLLSLVNDVLDMNKLESGKFTPKHEPFSLRQILDEIIIVAETQAQESGIDFIHQSTQEVEHDRLIGSPVYLKRIIMNFTSNAIKYNRQGGKVNVYGRELSFDGKTAWYEFICEDTGIGMSEEFQKKAFDAFTQEEQSQARTQYGGTGLGLAISKSLAELLGGTIELNSVLGEGTKVVFRLPIEVDLEQHHETSDADYSGVRFDGVKVLLAEDNDLNAEIAKFLLEQRGISVKWVENGRLALDEIKDNPDSYDAVFMDIMMPVMNGLDASTAIRTELGNSVPIFAMTANAFTDDIQRSLDAGMNEHLTKPLKENDIIRALLKYLKKEQE